MVSRNYIALVLPLAFSLCSSASAFTGRQYLTHSDLSLKQAQNDALKAYPGKIDSVELEKEAGGSGLRYSFVIAGNKGKHEVGIDAKTGKLLENSVEGPNSD